MKTCGIQTPSHNTKCVLLAKKLSTIKCAPKATRHSQIRRLSSTSSSKHQRPLALAHTHTYTMSLSLAKTLSHAATRASRSTGSAQRFINSTATRSWDEVRAQRHAGDISNKHLQLPQTVAVIGAPMTRTSMRSVSVLIVSTVCTDVCRFVVDPQPTQTASHCSARTRDRTSSVTLDSTRRSWNSAGRSKRRATSRSQSPRTQTQ